MSQATNNTDITHTTPPTLEKKIQKWVELDNEIKNANEEIKDIDAGTMLDERQLLDQ